jgi:hypothetical protein
MKNQFSDLSDVLPIDIEASSTSANLRNHFVRAQSWRWIIQFLCLLAVDFIHNIMLIFDG